MKNEAALIQIKDQRPPARPREAREPWPGGRTADPREAKTLRQWPPACADNPARVVLLTFFAAAVNGGLR
jgi:hypothetical protein